jgi:hypothetical protein
MTYEQYKQLYDAAKAQIEARVARIQPRAGNRASVNGMGISIDPLRRDEVATEPTWRYFLFGRAVGTSILNGESTDFDTGVQVAAAVSRVTGAIGSTSFWERTQLYDILPEAADPFSRFFTLYLTSDSANTPGDWLGFRFPTLVVIEMVKSLDGGISYTEVVSEYNFIVGYRGANRGFTAPQTNEQFILRIKSIERL